jgi:hypothetical protein
MQISLAIMLSLIFFASQLAWKPYRNAYHNEMAGLVNMQIVVGFLLF